MAGVIISIVCISCAFLIWSIADKRGANTRFWALMGAVFGPLAIPFVFLTKDHSSKADPSNHKNHDIYKISFLFAIAQSHLN